MRASRSEAISSEERAAIALSFAFDHGSCRFAVLFSEDGWPIESRLASNHVRATSKTSKHVKGAVLVTMK